MMIKKVLNALPIISKDAKTATAIISQKQFLGYAGWTGYSNLGDEAVYQANKNLFPEIISFFVDKRIEWLMQKTHREIPLKAFCLGGGTLINRSNDWFQIAKYAYKRSVPSFCMGSGVASSEFWTEYAGSGFKNNIIEWASILNNFEFVGVRGPQSQRSLKEVGVKSAIVGDSAFSLNVKSKAKLVKGKIIGVNVCYGTGNVMWGDQQAFVEQIKEFIRLAINNNYSVVLLPMWTDDEQLSLEIAQDISSPNCTIIKSYSSVESYFDAISECDVFLGEKLHATIFSCMLGIPSIMLAYRPKCFDFMESIEMKKYCVRTDRIEANELWELCKDLISDRNLSKNLHSYTRYYKVLQNKHTLKIRKTLNLD